MAGHVIKFKNAAGIPKQPNEKLRLTVVSGPDSGAVFSISGSKVRIGRADDNDIAIDDLKSSRHHAEVTISADGKVMVNDLGSANGIVYNGTVVTQSALKPGDRFMVGESLFEVGAVGGETSFSSARKPGETTSATGVTRPVGIGPAYRMPVAGGGPRPAPRPAALGAAPGLSGTATGPGQESEPTPIQQEKAKGAKKRLIILGVVVLAFVYLFTVKPQPKTPKPGMNTDVPTPPSRPVTTTGEDKLEKESKKTAERFFREGFREFRERNYFRARANFESALQMQPDHQLSKIYLSNTIKSIDEEVDKNMRDAILAMNNLKYRKAASHFETVMTLLAIDPTQEKYKQAKEGLEEVTKRMEESE